MACEINNTTLWSFLVYSSCIVYITCITYNTAITIGTKVRYTFEQILSIYLPQIYILQLIHEPVAKARLFSDQQANH